MKFREGLATEESWHTVTARLNVGYVAATQNDIPADKIKHGLDAIVNVMQRYIDSGRWGVSGEDYRAIGDALVEIDNIQLSLTRRQFAKAIKYVFANAAM